jgi:hypothetical protein
MQFRRTAVAITSAAALSVTGIALATPANAQPNRTVQEGLVNVAVQDVIVQLPIAIAANVCDVSVAILAQQTVTGPVDCTAVAAPEATFGGRGNNNARQEGLVNVLVQDLTIQAPIGVAANICGLNVAALAEQVREGNTNCDAETTPIAEA